MINREKIKKLAIKIEHEGKKENQRQMKIMKERVRVYLKRVLNKYEKNLEEKGEVIGWYRGFDPCREGLLYDISHDDIYKIFHSVLEEEKIGSILSYKILSPLKYNGPYFFGIHIQGVILNDKEEL